MIYTVTLRLESPIAPLSAGSASCEGLCVISDPPESARGCSVYLKMRGRESRTRDRINHDRAVA